MKPITYGNATSGVEVTHISKHGIWSATRDHEIFISFKEFPQFQDASVRKIMHVEQPTPTCLHWPDLGIDLAVESIRCFPLTSKPSRPTTRSSRQAKTKPITQSESDRCSAPIRTSVYEQSTSLPRIHVRSDEEGTAQSTD